LGARDGEKESTLSRSDEVGAELSLGSCAVGYIVGYSTVGTFSLEEVGEYDGSEVNEVGTGGRDGFDAEVGAKEGSNVSVGSLVSKYSVGVGDWVSNSSVGDGAGVGSSVSVG